MVSHGSLMNQNTDNRDHRFKRSISTFDSQNGDYSFSASPIYSISNIYYRYYTTEVPLFDQKIDQYYSPTQVSTSFDHNTDILNSQLLAGNVNYKLCTMVLFSNLFQRCIKFKIYFSKHLIFFLLISKIYNKQLK